MPGYGKFSKRSKTRTYGSKRRAASTAASKIQRAARAKLARSKPVRGVAQRAKVNTISITKLARAVSQLKRQQVGSYQTQRQRCEVDGHIWGHAKPIAICLENIYEDSRVYSGAWNYVAGKPEVFEDARFRKYTLRNGLDGANSQTIPDEYNYWANAQDDSVSLEKFLPLSTSFDITFAKAMSPLDDDIWIRMDVVKVKKHMLHSPAHMLALPDNLQGIGNMALSATSLEQQKNAFNPQYFSVIQTKWVKLSLDGQRYHVNTDTHDAAGDTSTVRNYKDVQRTVKMYHKFASKMIVPDLKTLNTEIDGVNMAFVRSQEPEHLTWLVFNVSCAANAPNILIRRTNRWRDSDGIAA